MKKDDVLKLLGDLPDEFPPDELMYRLYLKQKVDHAEAAPQPAMCLLMKR